MSIVFLTFSQKKPSTSRVILQSVKIFTIESSRKWSELNDSGKVVGKVIWVNPREKEIEKLFSSIENQSKSRGLKGWHCPADPEDMQRQAMNNKDGELDSRENKHGEGLYLGPAKFAHHFTGGRKFFKIVSTSKYGLNAGLWYEYALYPSGYW